MDKQKKILVFEKGGVKEKDLGHDKNTRDSAKDKRSLALASGLGFDIIAPIILGVIIGRLIDGKLGTQPRVMLFLLFLGVFIGFYNVYKVVKSMN